MKAGFLDKLIDRLDRLDAGSLQAQFLRLSREKGLLETIFHALQEGLVVLDGQARIVFHNRAAQTLLGLPADGALGEPLRRWLRDVEWDRILRLDEGEWSRLLNREIEINYPEHRFLAFYVVPLRLEQPREKGAVMLLRDVTRDRAQEAQSLESERLRAVTLLAAGVAHEIGNPLNSLTIHLQLLRRELAGMAGDARAPLDGLLDVSVREVERLDQIIRQFLQAVRPVAPHLEVCALPEVVRDTLEFMRPELSDRKVLVECEEAGDLPAVKLDRAQMRQVFFNLIKNAVEAMSGRGVLRIWYAAGDRSVAVSIRDTGPGIPAERLAQVFEPYFTTKERGSGLGLMIVQRIVRDHGGELEIHSEPGRGATVTVSLPRADRLIRLLKAPPRAGGESPEPNS